MMPVDEIEAYVKVIEMEKWEEHTKKKARGGGSSGGSLLPQFGGSS